MFDKNTLIISNRIAKSRAYRYYFYRLHDNGYWLKMSILSMASIAAPWYGKQTQYPAKNIMRKGKKGHRYMIISLRFEQMSYSMQIFGTCHE